MSTQYKQQQPALDWLSFAVDDIHAPHPDLFEFDLENSLNGVDQSQLQMLNLDFNADPYQFFRDENTACGPPSTITISSESTYDTHSNHSESLYSFPHSPTYSSVDSVYSSDLQMGFAKFSVDASDSAVAAPQHINPTNSLLINDADADPNSFGELPVSPYDSVSSGSSFDYDSSQSINPVTVITPAEFYLNPQRVGSAPQRLHPTSTVSPISIPHPVPRLTLSMSDTSSMSSSGSQPHDSRRKYQCSSCPRSFARAYNLKTHMATHDPHRLKPFVCSHPSCGRSFSRKHDLGRHLVSIHHDDPEDKKIGVQNGSRQWCDTCGKGWTSASSACGCDDET